LADPNLNPIPLVVILQIRLLLRRIVQYVIKLDVTPDDTLQYNIDLQNIHLLTC